LAGTTAAYRAVLTTLQRRAIRISVLTERLDVQEPYWARGRLAKMIATYKQLCDQVK
jgi:hypothetical protein